jgi:multicomponent K+:H+ antiporter subunit E
VNTPLPHEMPPNAPPNAPPDASPSLPPDARREPVPPRSRRWPRPWTVLWLWLAWLLLNQSLAPGHLLLGGVLALVFASVAVRRAPPYERAAARAAGRSPWQRPRVALRLFAVVLHDIVVANLQVARRILGTPSALRPQFVWVPLDVRQPRSIALLAGIVTMTPGTLSAELSDDHGHLLVHGLDVEDPAALIAEIKGRYETPIRELFE